MIYRTFKEWKNGNYLEDLEPRKEAYTRDELLLIEMGWKYGFDAGVEAGRKDENEVCAELVEALSWLVAAVDADGYSTKYQRGLSKASYALAKAQGKNND